MWPHSKAQRGDGKGGPGILSEEAQLAGVLAEYGWKLREVILAAIRPGFSGARVWKVDAGNESYALRQWPAGHPVHLPLGQIHELMRVAVDAGLSMVPRVIPARSGMGHVLHEGTVWEVTTWQPGEADGSPDEERVAAAMQVLARLHAVWRRAMPARKAVCTAVEQQFERLMAWSQEEFLLIERQAGLEQSYRQALALFRAHRESAIKRLQPWLRINVILQPCLADIWSDHVLFTGTAVTGVIDYGAMRLDHPAQDLARILGSWAPGNAALRAKAMAAYQPMTQEMEKLVVTLEESGAVVGMGNWLRWVCLEGRSYDRGRVHERIQVLMKRLCQSHDVALASG